MFLWSKKPFKWLNWMKLILSSGTLKINSQKSECKYDSDSRPLFRFNKGFESEKYLCATFSHNWFISTCLSCWQHTLNHVFFFSLNCASEKAEVWFHGDFLSRVNFWVTIVCDHLGAELTQPGSLSQTRLIICSLALQQHKNFVFFLWPTNTTAATNDRHKLRRIKGRTWIWRLCLLSWFEPTFPTGSPESNTSLFWAFISCELQLLKYPLKQTFLLWN